MSRTPYRHTLWPATRAASRNQHSHDASTMVVMIGEIDLDRYAGLPPLHARLQSVYRDMVGSPPASRDADLGIADKPKGGRGPNPHPTRSRRPGASD